MFTLSLFLHLFGLFFNSFFLTIGLNLSHNFFFSLSKISLLLLSFYLLFFLPDFFFLPFNSFLLEFDGLFQFSYFKLIFIFFIYFCTFLILFNFSSGLLPREIPSEIFLILFSNLLGIFSLLFSNDWLISIISWELFNLSGYLFISLNTSSESSFSSSLKYILLSSFSTSFFFLGISFIYFHTGSTNFDSILLSFPYLNSNLSFFFGYLLILFTLFFKLGSAPFHMWAPDLYNNLDTRITQYFILIPKLTIFLFLFLIFSQHLLLFSFDFHFFFLFFALSSLIFGSLSLFSQIYLKRFLAFSSLSHLGFLFFGLYSLDFYSFFFYLFVYILTNLNLFFFLSFLNNSFSDLFGLFRFNPFFALAFSLNFFSLAGRFVCFIFFSLFLILS